MKKVILLFFVLLLFVACANQHHEDSIVWRKGQSGLAGDSSYTEPPDGPMIEQNGAFVELGPTGLSEETILIQLTDTANPQLWSPENHTMKNYLGKDVTSTVGFGQLKGDINKQGENIYAISFQNSRTPMWLHITVGTNIDGVFKKGVLIDFFGNEWKVTNLTFAFYRWDKGYSQYSVKQPIKDSFENNTASGQISAVGNGSGVSHPITEGAVGYQINIKLKLRVEATVQDKSGYQRTLTLERSCGGKFVNVAVETYEKMFRNR